MPKIAGAHITHKTSLQIHMQIKLQCTFKNVLHRDMLIVYVPFDGILINCVFACRRNALYYVCGEERKYTFSYSSFFFFKFNTCSSNINNSWVKHRGEKQSLFLSLIQVKWDECMDETSIRCRTSSQYEKQWTINST